jgi:phosphoribosylformylglycinamidine synthase subunit PurSL
MDLMRSGFPQWEFEAHWQPAENRGFFEPVIGNPNNFKKLTTDMLSRPNICSKEWIARQYDHEVQATSVIKPLVGVGRDIHSDAAVIRPVLDSTKGLAFSQSLIPEYSAIDAYHMTACTIDEAVRRVLAVGGDPAHIGGVDNFCWPDIGFDPDKNPDGKFKAAQLVRSCQALRDICLAYEIPLLSGKDSMYVDGHLSGPYGETHKVSALETLQFSAISLVPDVAKCMTLDSKMPGDLVYVLGITRNELGGSEYYHHLGYVGLNVPKVTPSKFSPLYRALFRAIDKELVASAHGVYRGGFGVHLPMVAMGGHLGMNVDLSLIPSEGVDRIDTLLFSETPGRFIVTVAPKNQETFNKLFKGIPYACIGNVTEHTNFVIHLQDNVVLEADIFDLKSAWKKPFESL